MKHYVESHDKRRRATRTSGKKKKNAATKSKHLSILPLKQYWCVSPLISFYQWRTQEFCLGGGSTNSVGDREGESGGGSPLVRGSGGSYNLVEEIPFYEVKDS